MQKALRDADQALRVDPKDEEAYNSRGLANRLLGKLDEAAVYQRALSAAEVAQRRKSRQQGAAQVVRRARDAQASR